jgi:hypothetical protein
VTVLRQGHEPVDLATPQLQPSPPKRSSSNEPCCAEPPTAKECVQVQTNRAVLSHRPPKNAFKFKRIVLC